MNANVDPIPQGFRTLTPHLTVRDANKAIEFYKKAFGAELTDGPCLATDGKSVMHAAMKIGDCMIMLNDEFPDMDCFSPLSKESHGVRIHLYADDADAIFQRAIDAGATAKMPLTDMFWGDRYGQLKDPFGHEWSVGMHIEDVSEEEMARRAEKAMAGGGCQ